MNFSLQCQKHLMKLIKHWADAKGTLTKSLTILYKTFVHPHLVVRDIDTLETMQRRATKLVPFISSLNLHSLYVLQNKKRLHN